MHQFEISSNGLLREASVSEVVAKLKERFPEVDAGSIEATLMLNHASAMLQDQRSPSWKEWGVTGHRFTVLRQLYLAKRRRLSMGEIASDLNRATPNITQLVDGLEKDGLVKREVGPEDKRVIYAALTDEGTALFETAFVQNSQRLKEAWAPLTPEEKSLLIHFLARLRVHVLSTSTPNSAR